MAQENIAVGNWTQTHDQIYLNSRGGAIMLDSSKPNGMIKLLADTTLGLATSQAGIYVDSTTRDTPAPSLSGSIAVIAEGVTPAVRLAAVPRAPDANGSVLTLGTTGAVLSTGMPTTGSHTFAWNLPPLLGKNSKVSILCLEALPRGPSWP